MITSSCRIILDNAKSIDPNPYDYIKYTDETGVQFLIPMKLVLRLYSVAEHECRMAGNSWDEECDRIMRS